MPNPRLENLYRKQHGLCWICGFPMLPPKDHPPHKCPNAYEATIDHLVERRSTNGAMRPIKAAHKTCNTSRHHYPPDHPKVKAHIMMMTRRFSNERWLKSTGFSSLRLEEAS